MGEAVSNVVKIKIHAMTDGQLCSVNIRLIEKYRDGNTLLNQETWKKTETLEWLK